MNGIYKINKEQAEFITDFSKSIGFTHCGFATVQSLDDESKKLKQWLGSGFNAEMNFFHNTIDARKNPEKILPGAKTMIVLLKNYYHNKTNPVKPYKLARYAYGIDYHIWMKNKLISIQNYIDNIFHDNKSKIYSDTGPVMEKVWAKKAGLGWTGKNTLLINPVSGSFCFIGVILTTLELGFITESVENRCGNCTKCIDACPTKALSEPGVLDARKCIAYLTIEKKGEFTNEQANSLNSWIFGCDICQEVCPYNKYIVEHNEIDFETLNEISNLNININSMSQSQFRKKYAKSAINRCGLKSMLRNYKANNF